MKGKYVSLEIAICYQKSKFWIPNIQQNGILRSAQDTNEN